MVNSVDDLASVVLLRAELKALMQTSLGQRLTTPLTFLLRHSTVLARAVLAAVLVVGPLLYVDMVVIVAALLGLSTAAAAVSVWGLAARSDDRLGTASTLALLAASAFAMFVLWSHRGSFAAPSVIVEEVRPNGCALVRVWGGGEYLQGEMPARHRFVTARSPVWTVVTGLDRGCRVCLPHVVGREPDAGCASHRLR